MLTTRLTISLFVTLFILAAAGERVACASSSGVTYQGRILKPDGSPLSGEYTQFRLQIRTPDSTNCLLYEEIQNLDLRNSNGNFSLTINDGSGSRTDTTGFNLDRIFANRGSFTFDPSNCSSGNTYAPNESDGRSLVVLFKDETMASWEPVPTQMINFVPFAFETKQVQGFTADSLLRVVNGSGDPMTGLSPLSNAQYTELLSLVNGTSSAYEQAGQLGGAALPTLGVAQAGQVLSWNGTGWETASSSSGVTADSVTSTTIVNGTITGADLSSSIAIDTTSNISSSGTISATNSMITPQIYGSSAASGNIKIDGTSDATKGNVLLASAGGNVGIGTTSPNSKLHIAGSTYFTNLQLNNLFTGGTWHQAAMSIATYDGGAATGGASSTLYLTTTRGSSGSTSAMQSGDELGTISFQGTGANASPIDAGKIVMEADGTWTGTSSPGRLLFKTVPSGSTTTQTRMTIVNGGNVGIGTSSPQATLDINGDVRLKVNSSAPVTCSSTYNGRVALTSQFTLCVCKGSASSWVRVTDGSTACSW